MDILGFRISRVPKPKRKAKTVPVVRSPIIFNKEFFKNSLHYSVDDRPEEQLRPTVNIFYCGCLMASVEWWMAKRAVTGEWGDWSKEEKLKIQIDLADYIVSVLGGKK